MRGFYLTAILLLTAEPASAMGKHHPLMAHFQRQHTDSACSVASIANVVNALRAAAPPISPEALLTLVGDSHWIAATAMGSDGVSFAEIQLYLRQSLDRLGLTDARVEIFRPRPDDESLDHLRRLLSHRQGTELVLASFDQGWLLGEASVGHVSPLGDYDAERRQVQILDVDPEHPTPYWVSDQDLLAAMTRASDDPTGDGLIIVRPGHIIRSVN
ncbi:MAG: hypothetical protein H7Z12_13605 [Rhodospirillaceae bacterium]|nr:hypothetical protein [Rhodospirillales bacterium]